jgi:outer membrane protein assembly factor BamB
MAVEVDGPERFPEAMLRIPIQQKQLVGFEPSSVRLFRFDENQDRLRPRWRSGLNHELGYVFAPIHRPGIYVALAVPRDPLVRELLRVVARQRRLQDDDDEWGRSASLVAPLLDADPEQIAHLRASLALLTVESGVDALIWRDVRIGNDGAIEPFPLPGDLSWDEFRDRLGGLVQRESSLPEEELFFPPDLPHEPWPWPPRHLPVIPELEIHPVWFEWLRIFDWLDWLLCLFWRRNWWMYQHDAQHTGRATCSAIRTTNAYTLGLRHKLALDGPVISQPVVSYGKVYVGSGNSAMAGTSGTLYRIDLATGSVEASFSFSGLGSRQGFAGVGSSPAVVGGKVYVSGLDGRLYCLDASNLTPLWITDLRHTDLAHNQPVEHGTLRAEGWSSPLVVNGRVYVGFGEGEDQSPTGAFGFVYCLDANTGSVVWLFCTNQFTSGTDNNPNVIPPSTFVGTPPAPFTTAAADPPTRGASPWSSAAFDAGLNRIYIGTGNSRPTDEPLPEPRYSNGMLSLDAYSGAFRGFFQPHASDNYRPTADMDVDVPGGPTVFSRDGERVVGIGTKGGSYFLIDADTLAVVERRQLLPYDSGGNPFPLISPGTGHHENLWGVFGTAGLHPGIERVFVALGGYSGAIDHNTTPFLRAMHYANLADAWPTAGTNPPKYTAAQPPMYTTAGETGLSSPAVVNDVVFVSTTKPGLYALRAADGFCLWAAPGFGPGAYCLGPAVYGSYVVAGTGNHLYIYSL